MSENEEKKDAVQDSYDTVKKNIDSQIGKVQHTYYKAKNGIHKGERKLSARRIKKAKKATKKKRGRQEERIDFKKVTDNLKETTDKLIDAIENSKLNKKGKSRRSVSFQKHRNPVQVSKSVVKKQVKIQKNRPAKPVINKNQKTHDRANRSKQSNSGNKNQNRESTRRQRTEEQPRKQNSGGNDSNRNRKPDRNGNSNRNRKPDRNDNSDKNQRPDRSDNSDRKRKPGKSDGSKKNHNRRSKKEIRLEIIGDMDKKTLKSFRKLSYHQQNKVLKAYAKDETIARNKKTVIRYGKGSKPYRLAKTVAKTAVKTPQKVLAKQIKIAKFIASENRAEQIKQMAINKAKEKGTKAVVKVIAAPFKFVAKLLIKLLLNVLAALGGLLLIILAAAIVPVLVLALILFIAASLFGDTLITLKDPVLYLVSDVNYANISYGTSEDTASQEGETEPETEPTAETTTQANSSTENQTEQETPEPENAGTILTNGEAVCTVAMFETYVTDNHDKNPSKTVEWMKNDYFKPEEPGKVDEKIWKTVADQYEMDYTEYTEWNADLCGKLKKVQEDYIDSIAKLSEEDFKTKAKHCYWVVVGMTKEKTSLGEKKTPVLIVGKDDTELSSTEASNIYVYSPVKGDITHKYTNTELNGLCEKYYVFTQRPLQ